MDKKLVPSKNYFIFSTYTTLNKLHDLATAEVDKLFAKAGELGLQQTGPLEFIYFDCTNDRDKEFLLEIALPVASISDKVVAGYSFRKHEDFNCVSYIHKGEMEKLPGVYEKLYTEIWNNSIRPGNQIREVYSVFTDSNSPDNITEIQIGIQG